MIVLKKQSYKKRSLIVFIKTIVFKNDRYSFSKFKTSGSFSKIIFSENETTVFENDLKTKQKMVDY